MAYTKLIRRTTPGASVEEFSAGAAFRLAIPSGAADGYRLAQLDDYAKLRRVRFPLRPPVTLRLAARTSHGSIPGTWGFGLWNDPFGLSLGFGGNPLRLPALPNAAWFFGASQESYLSFRADRVESRPAHPGGAPSPQNQSPAHGFLAQAFRSPAFHPLLILAGLAFPLSRRLTRRLMGRIVDESGLQLDIDVTQWHRYALTWRDDQVLFEVDGAPVFGSGVSPHSPLGLVIWIDNQYAAFTPEGRVGFGVLASPEPVWLEIRDLEVEM